MSLLEAIVGISRPAIPPQVWVRCRQRTRVEVEMRRQTGAGPEFQRCEKQRLEVEVRDKQTGELLGVMDLQGAGAWLREFGFKCALGSDGVWVREVGHG